jgi:hypothetical protein
MSLADGSSADLSASERLIGRLVQLAARDREWILAHLSAGAKANLLRHLGQDEAKVTADRPQALDDDRVLDTVEGETVAHYLSGEPSWVIALILSLRAWRWEQQVLMKLPPVARLEVNQLRHTLSRPSAAMRALVMRTLREQLAAPSPGSRFEDLLDQARDRAP